MSNYKKLENLTKQLKYIMIANPNAEGDFLDQLDIYHSLYVMNIYDGKFGYVVMEGEDIALYVLNENTSKYISKEELNNYYIETPKQLLEIEDEKIRFILCPYKKEVGVVSTESENSFKVYWEDSKEALQKNRVKWITQLVGVKTHKIQKKNKS